MQQNAPIKASECAKSKKPLAWFQIKGFFYIFASISAKYASQGLAGVSVGTNPLRCSRAHEAKASLKRIGVLRTERRV